MEIFAVGNRFKRGSKVTESEATSPKPKSSIKRIDGDG
jgi:hypothetical protein